MQKLITESISIWQDVRRILVAEEDIVIAQKSSGELLCAGSTQDLYGTFGKNNFIKLQDYQLMDACSYYGGESMRFAFLDDEKILHDNKYGSSEDETTRYIQLVGLDHCFLGLKDNGIIVSFQGLNTDHLMWPLVSQVAIGRNRNCEVFLVGLAEK